MSVLVPIEGAWQLPHTYAWGDWYQIWQLPASYATWDDIALFDYLSTVVPGIEAQRVSPLVISVRIPPQYYQENGITLDYIHQYAMDNDLDPYIEQEMIASYNLRTADTPEVIYLSKGNTGGSDTPGKPGIGGSAAMPEVPPAVSPPSSPISPILVIGGLILVAMALGKDLSK